ncbi:MAG: type II toxin-antitoxin system RelE/ParE family toxin [Bacteroidales bacterium]|nr:type II toxin-antitoxin system RelE/ParE family toxin [Bacteroidales bacterium]
MKINWMPRAVESFFKIGDFLEETFGEKQTDKFIEQVRITIERIEKQPYMYRSTKKNKLVRKGFVNKNVSMFYLVKKQKNEIDLIEFWDNRQDPKKLNH